MVGAAVAMQTPYTKSAPSTQQSGAVVMKSGWRGMHKKNQELRHQQEKHKKTEASSLLTSARI